MADWQTIRDEYEQGASLRTLAAKHGISKSLIGKKKFEEQWTAKVDSVDSGRKQAQNIENPTPVKNTLSTKDKQRLFLEAYAQHANVMLSAREAGIHRTTVYDWLEHDEDFSFAYNQAKEDAKDVLRAEIYRRGKEGWDEPIFQQGKFVDVVRKFDSTLLMFHSKMLMPEYREKSQIDVNTTTKTVEIYKVKIPDNGRNE